MAEELQAQNSHEVKHVAKGSVSTKKQNPVSQLVSIFISEDWENTKKYIVDDVVKPGLKTLSGDIALAALGYFIWQDPNAFMGGKKSVTFGPGSGKTNYTGFFKGQSNAQKYSEQPKKSETIDYKNIVMANRADAMNAINEMAATAKRYHRLTVGDICDICCLPTKSTYFEFGWEEDQLFDAADHFRFDYRVIPGGCLITGIPTARSLDI